MKSSIRFVTLQRALSPRTFPSGIAFFAAAVAFILPVLSRRTAPSSCAFHDDDDASSPSVVTNGRLGSPVGRAVPSGVEEFEEGACAEAGPWRCRHYCRGSWSRLPPFLAIARLRGDGRVQRKCGVGVDPALFGVLLDHVEEGEEGIL
jgi:hypothetical protein